MRELKDLHTCGCDDGTDAVLHGVAHGLKQQLDLPSLDNMPKRLHSLLRQACEACDTAPTEQDA
ncbi:hypothetical protein ACQKJ1_28800 [Methylorubrum rhodesianum]|uniref:hypothetical protein n=1 Tax=Methylorubrum rhodesianum TaxID=29427 RepID=UPI003CFD1461